MQPSPPWLTASPQAVGRLGVNPQSAAISRNSNNSGYGECRGAISRNQPPQSAAIPHSAAISRNSTNSGYGECLRRSGYGECRGAQRGARRDVRRNPGGANLEVRARDEHREIRARPRPLAGPRACTSRHAAQSAERGGSAFLFRPLPRAPRGGAKRTGRRVFRVSFSLKARIFFCRKLGRSSQLGRRRNLSLKL